MPARAWRRAVRHLALMVEVWRTRRILATMDPRMLKDIGLSRSDALNEIGRAPWDIEPHL
jgi:uncharacterized protein YjiS (DUF1127 family)